MLLKFIYTLCLVFSLAFAVDAQGWQNLIQSDSLEGWKKVGGEATYTRVDDMIVGHTADKAANTFLVRGPYSDFILEFEVKCDPKLNSGVQIRSHVYEKETPQQSNPKRVREKGETYGYQCEIREDVANGIGCAGNFWDEGRRTKWLDDTVDGVKKQQAYRPGEWNKFRIVAQGNRIQSFVNDVPVADFTDDLDATGFIGLQVHGIKAGAGPYEVAWKNIRIREISAN